MIKFVLISVFFISSVSAIFSQNSIDFEEYFFNRTMRIDYYHIGNADEEVITVDRIYEYEIWAGNPDNLIDPFNYGHYFIKVYDLTDNALIYSRGFSSYFGEYQTTTPAIEGLKRTYHESALIPSPKNPVLFNLEVRDKGI